MSGKRKAGAKAPARIRFSDKLSAAELKLAYAFMARTYWAAKIPMRTFLKGCRGSRCFGAFRGRELVAFGRVITDGATFAYLSDFFVHESERGQGVGKRFVAQVLGRAEWKGLRRMVLVTLDAHGLYARFGFRPLKSPGTYMEIHRPDVYRR